MAAVGNARSKVLLMGKSGSGKTSMRSIIFANYLARDTSRLNPTLDVEHSQVRFMGNLVLNLWDCGGQDAFYESYFASQRDHIFRNVQVLIYVFDIESRDLEKDLNYYSSCMEAIAENSPDAKVFCLVHKMDLIPDSSKEKVFEDRCALIRSHSHEVPIFCFQTSIWDETLYKAWSSIVFTLIPNTKVLQAHLDEFCKILDADEVVLFERATFLVIAHACVREHRDVHRFEKISNIIKQFKLSCSKTQSQFQAMRVRNSKFSAFIEQFTPNTYCMVITSDSSIPEAATMLNIEVAQHHFNLLIKEV